MASCMKLAAYLREKNIDAKEFAKSINVKQPSVSRYLTGARIPRPEKIKAIQEATDGAVTANDFFSSAEAVAT